MDVDTRAREAADAVRRSVEVDVERGLRDLVAQRRRRTVENVVAAAAAVVLAIVTVEVVVGATRDDTDPATEDRASTIFYTPDVGSGIGSVRDGEDLGSGHGLDVDVEPADMAVSADGSILALVAEDDGLTLVDLASGRSAHRRCSRCFQVAWLPDGDVATLGIAPGGTVQALRHDVRGGEPSRVLRLPDGVPLSGFAPRGDLTVAIGPVGGSNADRLVLTRGAGGDPTPLDSTETEPGEYITDVVWSPDASMIGYVVSSPARDRIGGRRYHLHTVLPDGSLHAEVADLGRCACTRDRPPTFAWSSDGGSVVAVLGDSVRGQDLFQVVTLDLAEVAATPRARRDDLFQAVASDAGSPVAWASTPP
jgi:hypothetical protein